MTTKPQSDADLARNIYRLCRDEDISPPARVDEATTLIAQHVAARTSELQKRKDELEANEAGYEAILGPRTYREVADEISALKARTKPLVEALEDFVGYTETGDITVSAGVLQVLEKAKQALAQEKGLRDV